MAMWVMLAGAVIQMVGQMQQAKDAKVQGQNMNLAEQYRAAQMEQAAGQEIASSQRARMEEERRARIMASRAMAVAGASGGGVADPTVVDLIADIEGEGAYRSGVAIYEGQERARQLRQGGASARHQGMLYEQSGNASAAAMRTKAVGGALMSAGSLYSKYGGGMSQSSALDGSIYDSRFTDMQDPRFG